MIRPGATTSSKPSHELDVPTENPIRVAPHIEWLPRLGMPRHHMLRNPSRFALTIARDVRPVPILPELEQREKCHGGSEHPVPKAKVVLMCILEDERRSR